MKTIGIFCGGFSSEFEISIKSATTILTNFPDGYNAFLIVVSKEKWTARYQNEEYSIDLNTVSFNANGEIVKINFGLVYIHGNPGENGKIQAFDQVFIERFGGDYLARGGQLVVREKQL